MSQQTVKHILITGAAGFVGSNLVPYLQAHLPGVHITRVARKRTSGELAVILWEELSEASFQDIDAVIHLAGKAHDTKNTSAAREYFDVNFELTKKIYDLFLGSSAQKFIYMSSVKATADQVKGVLDEEHDSDPQTPYGKSKLQAENYIIQESQQSKDKSQDYYILRPCMIHGPGNKGNLNLLYQFVNKSLPYPLAAFQNRRSFLSIDNLSFVVQQLLTEKVPSGVYNLADDESLATNELIRIIAKIQNRSPRLWNISKGMIKAVSKIGDVLRLPLNSERLQKLTESYEVSNAKIKKALQIQRMPVDAKEGIEKTLKSFSR
ncbi:MAG TPA: NAD-dependent epimerase/dehydratase family protein [Flavipsychrobacter sp.]|nr:NAD-dependent epimerase/dehydratase family protein [Flavipsychrobacter sp.]